MCQRSAAPVGVDLLDDGVPAVGLLGLDQAERVVGEHRVVAVGRDQLALLAAVMRGAISACCWCWCWGWG